MKTNNRKQTVIVLAAAMFCFGLVLSAHASGTEVVTKKVEEETSKSVIEQATSEVVENAEGQVMQDIDATDREAIIEEQSKETEELDKKDATGVATDTDEGGSN